MHVSSSGKHRISTAVRQHAQHPPGVCERKEDRCCSPMWRSGALRMLLEGRERASPRRQPGSSSVLNTWPDLGPCSPPPHLTG